MCGLPSYIADRYAGILTKEDIGQLFGKLTERLGSNRSEAARQSGLTGKATYDWEKVGYVKLSTKQKVLETCLRIDFLDTVEYLLSRSSERTIDILRTILSTIYAEAVETNSKDQFSILFDRFDILRRRYRGLIRDQIGDEVADMVWVLTQKASELKVSIPQKSIDDISAKELLDMFPLIGDAFLENPQGAHIIAKTLDLPLESIDMLWPTLEKLRSAGKTFMATEMVGLGIPMQPDVMTKVEDETITIKVRGETMRWATSSTVCAFTYALVRGRLAKKPPLPEPTIATELSL